jgi:hypothetical protein
MMSIWHRDQVIGRLVTIAWQPSSDLNIIWADEVLMIVTLTYSVSLNDVEDVQPCPQ